MLSRRLSRPLATAAVLVSTALTSPAPASAGPAAALVRYDPEKKTGFVDRADVRKAFGWTDAKLAARASTIVFDHDFWTDDNYAVACGKTSFPVVHHRVFGRFELAAVVTRAPAHATGHVASAGRGTRAGYGVRGRLIGFRLTGARFGISGTSVAPAPGQPCPDDKGQTPGAKVTKAVRTSSTTGWALSARSGDVSRRLLTKTGREAVHEP